MKKQSTTANVICKYAHPPKTCKNHYTTDYQTQTKQDVVFTLQISANETVHGSVLQMRLSTISDTGLLCWAYPCHEIPSRH